MNITLSIPDEVVTSVREAARLQGLSLNALIRNYLEQLVSTNREGLAEQFTALWKQRVGHSGGWKFNRDDIYAERIDGNSKS